MRIPFFSKKSPYPLLVPAAGSEQKTDNLTELRQLFEEEIAVVAGGPEFQVGPGNSA